LQIAGNEVRPERVRWGRRVPLALQVSADRDETYVGRCTRVVALDLNATLDVAKVGLAASAIVDALKIPADLDAGADKPARLRALLNLDTGAHRHPTFEERGRALIGQDIAVVGCVASTVRLAFCKTCTFPVTVASDNVQDAPLGTTMLPVMLPLKLLVQLVFAA
jgi:hypothetical protein